MNTGPGLSDSGPVFFALIGLKRALASLIVTMKDQALKKTCEITVSSAINQ